MIRLPEGVRAEPVPMPLGRFVVVTDPEGVVHLAEWEDAALPRRAGYIGVRDRYFHLATRKSDAGRAVAAYFAGDVRAVEAVRVAMAGTEFQRAVWAALREIPAATTVTYGEIARRIGRPAAVRAVGLANGSNPVSVIVPCHRVIGADGTLTGYGGGLPRKRWLLDHETRHTGAAMRARPLEAPGGAPLQLPLPSLG